MLLDVGESHYLPDLQVLICDLDESDKPMQSLLIVIGKVNWNPCLPLPDQECCCRFLARLSAHRILLVFEE